MVMAAKLGTMISIISELIIHQLCSMYICKCECVLLLRIYELALNSTLLWHWIIRGNTVAMCYFVFLSVTYCVAQISD